MKIFRLELKKLLILLKSEPKSLMAGIIAPTIILLVFFLTLGNFTSLKIACVNNDSGRYSEKIETCIFSQISPLGNNPYFQKEKVSYDKAFELYKKDKVAGIIVINKDFSKDIDKNSEGKMQYYFNNYNSDMAKNLRLYLNEGLLDFQMKYNAGVKDLELIEKQNVKRQIDWFDIISVGVFLLAFFMGAMFNFLYLFHKEKLYGTLYEYRLSPKNIAGSFFARVTVSLIAGTVTSGINAVFIYFLTGINLLMYIKNIVFIVICLGSTYVFLACIIGLLAKSFNGSAVFSMVTAVLLWFLLGATASINYATGILKTIALCIPNSYGLAQIRDCVFEMEMSNINGNTGWKIIIGYMSALMFISLLMYIKKLNRQIR